MNNRVIEETIDFILMWEGGFVDHPADAGGPTNRGITLRTLSRWLGRDATVEELREIDLPTTVAIYDKFYIRDMPYRTLQDPWTFRYVVDMGVLHRPDTLARIVQISATPLLAVDGVFGPKTLSTVNNLSCDDCTAEKFRRTLTQERVLFYLQRVKAEPSQAAFVEGWVKRAFERPP